MEPVVDLDFWTAKLDLKLIDLLVLFLVIGANCFSSYADIERRLKDFCEFFQG